MDLRSVRDHLKVVLVALLLVSRAALASQTVVPLRASTSVPAVVDQRLLLLGADFDPLELPLEKDLALPGPVIVQLHGPITSAKTDRIAALGVELLHYLPHNAFLARLSDEVDPAVLRARPELRWVGAFRPEYKYRAGLLSALPDPYGSLELDLQLLADTNAVTTARAIEAASGLKLKVTAVHSQATRLLLRLLVPAAGIEAVVAAAAARPEVISVHQRLEPQLSNDHSVWVVQSFDHGNGLAEATATVPRQYPSSATVWQHGLLGQGQVVAVADSGVDPTCFFQLSAGAFPAPQVLDPPATGTVDMTSKVIAYYVEPGAAAYDDGCLQYHGTHVAASAVGDDYAHLAQPATGTPNQDHGDGMAPAAQLVVQDLGASDPCGLAGLSADLADIFEQAWQAGARIHSNSWNYGTPEYTVESLAMDEAMWRHEDFIFTASMGNRGYDPGDSTLGAPSTAKNIISVGGVTHGSSNTRADQMMIYSRGPTNDGRIKPDVVAPADDVWSARGGTSCSTIKHSGTSMATPTTAGSLALVREYFQRGFARRGLDSAAESLDPTGALLKAALLNGATPLGLVSGYDPLAHGPVSTIPSMDQGWGRVYLDGSLYFAGDPERVRYWHSHHINGVETGEVVELHLQVTSNATPLRVTLVWSDPPSTTVAASNLVNDLHLELLSPTGVTYRGNVFNNGWSLGSGVPDTLNPVEAVRLQHPVVGEWTIRVIGNNVPGTPSALHSHRQGFAVAARLGPCGSAVPATPTNLQAVDQGDAGVALSWNPVAGAGHYQILRTRGDCSADPATFSLLAETDSTAVMDTSAWGGFNWAYRVAADNGCTASTPSACVSTLSTGTCDLDPDFGGITTLSNTSVAEGCSMQVDWLPATAQCPLGPQISYNIYRSNTPLFEPSAGDLLNTTTLTSFEDLSVAPHQPLFYVVRAEDSTSGNSGAHGGNEDPNTVRLKGVAWSGTESTTGTFGDDGGDSSAWLDLEHPWIVSAQENHTGGGAFGYHSAQEGLNHPNLTCAAVTTPPLELAAGMSHQLAYWARYNLETSWDGVVVEISPDNGQSWIDLPPDGGYPGDFANTGDEPVNACGYPASHGAFNGPDGNDELSPWASYSSDLSAWDGATVRIRWRLSTDPGLEFEGFYLDDISVSSVRGPGPCCPPPLFAGITGAAAVSGQPAADLSWAAADETCDSGSLRYLVYAGDDGAVDWSAPVGSTISVGQRFLGLQPGTEYWFGVRAGDGYGNVDSNRIEAGPVTAQGDRPDGDVDCDGAVTAADLSLAAAHLFGASVDACATVDADRNGTVDANDLAAIIRYLHDGL